MHCQNETIFKTSHLFVKSEFEAGILQMQKKLAKLGTQLYVGIFSRIWLLFQSSEEIIYYSADAGGQLVTIWRKQQN